MEEVVVMDYEPEWRHAFAQEKIKILSAMTGLEARIEHIGSTAVQGLGAKPTIDIMAGVSELGLVDERYIRHLELIGYEYIPKPEFPERMFFRRGLWRAGTHHLHIYRYQGKHWNDQLLFREYLKKDATTRERYFTLKKELEAQFKHDRVSYTNGKADFIRSIIERARQDSEWARQLDIGGE